MILVGVLELKYRLQMAIGINIKKMKEGSNIYYYKVITYGINPFDFFISIKPLEKKICYYKDENFQLLLGCMQFDISPEFTHIPEITSSAARRVAIQALKAILKNDFPEHIGFAS